MSEIIMCACLLFEVCEFPIARHTHPCIAIHCDTMDLVRKVCGEGLVPDHGLVHEISGFLF